MVYLIGAGILGLANFVLVPLYTRALSPSQFGVYALVDVSIQLLSLLSLLKLDVAYLRVFADSEASRHRTIFSTILLTGAGVSLLCGLLLTAAMAGPFGARVFQTNDRSFAWVLLPIVLLESVQGLLLSDLRVRLRPIPYCASTIIRLLAILASSIWFLSVKHLGLYGLFLGRMCGDLAGVAFLLFVCRHSIGLHFDGQILRPMVGFGLPLVWSAFMVVSMDAVGRYMLSHYRGLEDVGYLGAAVKIGSVFQMLVTQPFGIAWGGLMFQIVKWPNAREVYSKIFTYVLVVGLVASFCMSIFTPQLFRIFATRAYAPAMVVFPLVLLVRAVGTLEYPASIGIYLAGRTQWFALIYSLGMVVNVAGNYFLDRRAGVWGVVWAWLAGWLLIVGLMRFVGQRFYRLTSDRRLWFLAALPWLILLAPFGRILHSALSFAWPAQVGLSMCIVVAFSLLLMADLRAASRRTESIGSLTHAGN